MGERKETGIHHLGSSFQGKKIAGFFCLERENRKENVEFGWKINEKMVGRERYIR